MWVFKSGVLTYIFGPNDEEVTEDGRKLQNEELHNFYSQNSFQVIKSRRMKWAGHISVRRDIRTKFWSGNLKERDHLRDLRKCEG
jgi:hypothetical protein